MKPYIKRCALVLGLILLCVPLLSQAEETPEPREFTLEEAIEYALLNNDQIKIADAKISKDEVSLEEAHTAYINAKRMDVFTSYDMYRLAKGYGEEAAKTTLMLSQKGKEQTVEGIKFSVTSSYFSLKNAQDEVDTTQALYDTAVKNLELGKQQAGLGVLAPIELIPLDLSVQNAKNTLDTAKRDLTYQMSSMNKTLGLPFNTPLILTDSLSITPPEEVDLALKKEEALKNRMEVISAQASYDLDTLNFELVKKWTQPHTYLYQEAEFSNLSAFYTLQDTKNTVALSVEKAYTDMLNAYDAVTLSQKSVDQLSEYYDVAWKKFELGLSTQSELTDSYNQLKDAMLNQNSAIYAYNMARYQFDLVSGIGISTVR